MIIVRIGGGLGNQFLFYAFGRCLQIKFNAELKFDMSVMEKYKTGRIGYFLLDKFNVQKIPIATQEEIQSINDKDWKILDGRPFDSLAPMIIFLLPVHGSLVKIVLQTLQMS